ncbi:MAG: flagellar protein FlaG [Steroidobacteraceae bacterium]
MKDTRPDACPTGILRVRNAVAPLDGFLRSVSRSLEFRRDANGTIVVAVRDLTTGEIIRQIPG